MIQLKNITKKYQSKTIFNHFNLKIEENELVAIVGNSGSGKSTLLNIIGLLEDIDDGEIIINNKTISNKKDTLLLMRHDIGYMFQNNALIDDFTVEENLNIVLKYSNLVEKLNALLFLNYFLKSQKLFFVMNQLTLLILQIQKQSWTYC